MTVGSLWLNFSPADHIDRSTQRVSQISQEDILHLEGVENKPIAYNWRVVAVSLGTRDLLAQRAQ